MVYWRLLSVLCGRVLLFWRHFVCWSCDCVFCVLVGVWLVRVAVLICVLWLCCV